MLRNRFTTLLIVAFLILSTLSPTCLQPARAKTNFAVDKVAIGTDARLAASDSGGAISYKDKEGNYHLYIYNPQTHQLFELKGFSPNKVENLGPVKLTPWGGYVCWRDESWKEHVIIFNSNRRVLLERVGKDAQTDLSSWGGYVRWKDEREKWHVIIFNSKGQVLWEKVGEDSWQKLEENPRARVSSWGGYIGWEDEQRKEHVIIFNSKGQVLWEKVGEDINAGVTSWGGYVEWNGRIIVFNTKGQVLLERKGWQWHTAANITTWGGYIKWKDEEKLYVTIFNSNGQVLLERAGKDADAGVTSWGGYVEWTDEQWKDHFIVFNTKGQVLLEIIGRLIYGVSIGGVKLTAWGGYVTWEDEQRDWHFTIFNSKGQVLLENKGLSLHDVWAGAIVTSWGGCVLRKGHATIFNSQGQVLLERVGEHVGTGVSLWGGYIRWEDKQGKEHVIIFDPRGQVLWEKVGKDAQTHISSWGGYVEWKNEQGKVYSFIFDMNTGHIPIVIISPGGSIEELLLTSDSNSQAEVPTSISSSQTPSSNIQTESSASPPSTTQTSASHSSSENATTEEKVPYWIDPITKTVWVKIPQTHTGSITLRITRKEVYPPNGDSVFWLFDDFSADKLDTEKWNLVKGYASLSDGMLVLGSSVPSDYQKSNVVATNLSFPASIFVGLRYKYESGDNDPQFGYILPEDIPGNAFDDGWKGGLIFYLGEGSFYGGDDAGLYVDANRVIKLPPPEPNKWHHAAMRILGNSVTVWFDGELIGTASNAYDNKPILIWNNWGDSGYRATYVDYVYVARIPDTYKVKAVKLDNGDYLVNISGLPRNKTDLNIRIKGPLIGLRDEDAKLGIFITTSQNSGTAPTSTSTVGSQSNTDLTNSQSTKPASNTSSKTHSFLSSIHDSIQKTILSNVSLLTAKRTLSSKTAIAVLLTLLAISLLLALIGKGSVKPLSFVALIVVLALLTLALYPLPPVTYKPIYGVKDGYIGWWDEKGNFHGFEKGELLGIWQSQNSKLVIARDVNGHVLAIYAPVDFVSDAGFRLRTVQIGEIPSDVIDTIQTGLESGYILALDNGGNLHIIRGSATQQTAKIIGSMDSVKKLLTAASPNWNGVIGVVEKNSGDFYLLLRYMDKDLGKTLPAKVVSSRSGAVEDEWLFNWLAYANGQKELYLYNLKSGLLKVVRGNSVVFDTVKTDDGVSIIVGRSSADNEAEIVVFSRNGRTMWSTLPSGKYLFDLKATKKLISLGYGFSPTDRAFKFYRTQDLTPLSEIREDNVFKMDGVPVGDDSYAIALQHVADKNLVLKFLQPDGSFQDKTIENVGKLIKLIGFDDSVALGFLDSSGHGILKFVSPDLSEKTLDLGPISGFQNILKLGDCRLAMDYIDSNLNGFVRIVDCNGNTLKLLNVAPAEKIKRLSLDFLPKDGQLVVNAITASGKALAYLLDSAGNVLRTLDMGSALNVSEAGFVSSTGQLSAFEGAVAQSGASTSDFSHSQGTFYDVPSDYWAAEAINFLVQNGYLSGYPDGFFRPDEKVKRVEFAKMLSVFLGLSPDYCDPSLFSDVTYDSWYCPYVTAVANAGYMIGYPDGTFGVDKYITKEEILTTIVRVRSWPLVVPTYQSFYDIPPEYWAYKWVETAVEHSLITPNDKGLTVGRIFGKEEPATRAQTSVLIYRGIFEKR